MDVEFAESGGNKRPLLNRLGPSGKNTKVCFYWQQGKCTRPNCHFLHSDVPASFDNGVPANNGFAARGNNNVHNGNASFSNQKRLVNPKWGRNPNRVVTNEGPGQNQWKSPAKVCNFWLAGKCKYGDGCKFLHSNVAGEDITYLTALSGHEKAVRGIALPSGSDKLFSGGQDQTVRVWDCNSGQCVGVENCGGEIGCLINEGTWVFVGIPNSVKALNMENGANHSLSGPNGQVHSLVVGNEMLMAGVQDGNILVWKFSAAGNCFEPAASLSGHTAPVVSLVVGGQRLYSGSMDKTIKVWDLVTLQCIQTLTDHTSVVMSLICWDQFLLSCSLDQTIKVWAATANGSLEVTYTHTEETGILALCGITDANAKPVLMCSCNDNTVRLYDLPSFNERGILFTKQEVRAIQIGPGGIFFTGDGGGELRVWKWLTEPTKG